MATLSVSALPAVADIGYEYDVFLSYYSGDRATVAVLATSLTGAGLKVWWDQDPQCMPAGAIWMVEMESGIRRSRTTVACIGPTIQGYWQREEYMLALNIQRERNNPVIPVLLPGSKRNEIPGFLALRSAADFSTGLENGDELNRLIDGIRTAPPTQPREPRILPPGLSPHLAAAVQELLESLARDNITFFVGSDTAPLPTRDCDIAFSLLSDLHIVSAKNARGRGRDGPSWWKPARRRTMLPPVDIAALYYAASKRDPGLEDTVTTLLQERGRFSSLHERLASILPRVMNFPRRRGRKPHRQLIIGLSLDTCLERALVSRRTKFVRIAARRDRGTLSVNDYRFNELHPDGSVTGPDNIHYPLSTAENQDDFIRLCGAREMRGDEVAGRFLGGDALLTPILFKPRGSHDLGGCAISNAHLFDIVSLLSVEGRLSDSIMDIVKHTASVFIGVRFIGPEMRLCMQCLLRGDLSPYPRYLFQPAPKIDSDDCFEHSEACIWEKIKARAQERSLTIVEHPPEEALAILADRLESAT